MKLCLLLALCLTLLPSWVGAADWAQFSGPHRNATLPDVFLQTDWTKNPPQQLWEFKLGEGFGGPAIVGDRIFLLDWVDSERILFRCLDLATGKEVWNFEEPCEGRLNYPGSRSTPWVDETRAYAISPIGVVYACDRATGKLIWRVNMMEKFKGVTPTHGFSQNAVKFGGVITAAPFGPEAGLVGLDPATGETKWSLGGFSECYCTPALLNLLGEDYMVFLTSTPQGGVMIGVDPAEGKVKWKCSQLSTTIAMPTRVSSDTLLLTGAYGAGTKLIRMLKDENGTITHQVLWSHPKGSQVHLPLIYQDHIYVLSNSNETVGTPAQRREGGLMCLDMNGKELWRTGDDPNFGRGGMLLIGDTLLVTDGDSGVVHLVKPTPDRYEQLSTFDPFKFGDGKDHRVWSQPVFCGDKLFVRSQEKLICFRVKLRGQ